MSYNGQNSGEVCDIVNYLVDFFASVYSDKSSNINDFVVSSSVSISSLEIGEVDIFNAISDLKHNLYAGRDDVSVRFLMNCKCILSHIFSIIFNESLSSGTFPHFWKISYITPL